MLYQKDTKQGVPPLVFGIKWNPWEVCPCQFASFGVKHINFWTGGKDAAREEWSFEPGAFLKKQDPGKKAEGSDVEVQDVLCVEFLPTNGNVVTGMSSGDMYIWKSGGGAAAKGGGKGKEKDRPGFVCERRVLVKPDPKRGLKTPTRAHYNALQVLVLRPVRNKGAPVQWTLLSGGGGGKIKIWGQVRARLDSQALATWSPLTLQRTPSTPSPRVGSVICTTSPPDPNLAARGRGAAAQARDRAAAWRPLQEPLGSADGWRRRVFETARREGGPRLWLSAIY